MGRVKRLAAAKESIVSIALDIWDDSPQSGARFLEAVEETFSMLATMPGMAKVCEFKDPRLHGLHYFRVKGFPKHLVFYRALEDGIEVVDILHGAQDLDAFLNEELMTSAQPAALSCPPL